MTTNLTAAAAYERGLALFGEGNFYVMAERWHPPSRHYLDFKPFAPDEPIYRPVRYGRGPLPAAALACR